MDGLHLLGADAASTGDEFVGPSLAMGGPSLDSVRAGKTVLKVGAIGAAVSYVQGIVGIPPDGTYSAETGKAVEKFQREAGLSVDGKVGKATIAAIDRRAAGLPIAGPKAPSAPATTSPSAPAPSAAGRPADDEGAAEPMPRWKLGVIIGLGAAGAGGVGAGVWALAE